MARRRALLAALSLISAPASAACWQPADAAAAQVREMQTMLMVTALRCHAAHIDITPDYNAFMAAGMATLTATNDRLKSHFRAEAGPIGGQRAYDSFTTQLANAYGAGATTGEDCARAAAILRVAATDGSQAGLLRLASATLFGTAVSACGAPAQTVAAAAPVSGPARREPVVVMLAAFPASAVALQRAPAAPVMQWVVPSDVAAAAPLSPPAPAPVVATLAVASAPLSPIPAVATARPAFAQGEAIAAR